MWFSHVCYKLVDTDVPTGFSYVSTGRQLRSRDRQTWQRWPRRASPQAGTRALRGHVEAWRGCARWVAHPR